MSPYSTTETMPVLLSFATVYLKENLQVGGATVMTGDVVAPGVLPVVPVGAGVVGGAAVAAVVISINVPFST